MIGYVMVGTKNMKRAAEFYDGLLAELGAKRAMEGDKFIAWSNGKGCMFSVCKPYDGNPSTVGNGVMVALAAPDQATVDRLYKKALELGGTDEGPAGPRGGNFYAGYFRDLDGNKLNAFCMG
ncbi:MAG: VOC family protein [Alphaproteobacteria bacterium]|nr:VOC family protein [Alphaproteobacteria bacterium]